MIRFFRYLRIRLKRSVRIYPVIIGFTVILSVCMLLLLGALLSEDASSESNIRMRVGLVGDIEDTHLGIGISVVKEIDTSRYYVEFVEFDSEEEADAALDSGDLMGYINVPDGFVDSVIHGENKHLTYVSARSCAGLGPLLVREVISIVSDLLTESQNGIYGMADIADKYEIEYSALYDGMEELNLIYFDSIFSREDTYEVNILGTGMGLGFADYYFCAFIIIIMLLWGIICVPLLVKRDTSLERLLYSRGCTVLSQSMAEYIPFLLLTFINTALLVTAGSVFMKEIDAEFVQILLSCKGILYLIPCILVITAMQFLIYELADSVVSAVLAQLLVTVGLSYISGFIYPSGALPESVQSVAALTPTGIAFGYLSGIFSADPTVTELLPPVVCFALLMAAVCVVRGVKIRRAEV